MGPASSTFSGYRRQRKTRLSVRFGEAGSRLLISLGGIGTIIAIVLVCVFLVWVAVPLFFHAQAEPKAFAIKPSAAEQPLLWGMDSEQYLGWSLLADGTLVSYRFDTGEKVHSEVINKDSRISAWSPPSRHDQLALGFADGTLRLARIVFDPQLLTEQAVPSELKAKAAPAQQARDGKLYIKNIGNSYSSLQVKLTLEASVPLSPGRAIRCVDLSVRTNGTVVCSVSEDGILRVSEVTEKKNLITGKVTRELSGGELALPAKAMGLPSYSLFNGVGDNVFLIWKTGELQRVNTRKMEAPVLVESVRLTDENVSITAVQFMIGKTSLLVGDSSGRVRSWFRTRPAGYTQGDATRLEAAHELGVGQSAVTALATSARSHLMAAGYKDGTIAIMNVTNELKLLGLTMPNGEQPQQLAFAPKEDGLYARGSGGMTAWNLHLGHPEASFRSYLRPIWYEGYAGPAHVWQSTSGDDAFEPKFGLWPLIFGTIKATLYSLLIGVPLALCAAVYSREFLHAKVRAVVKPTIEIMASLPSVVLGFLGALVVAPFVESVISAIITGLILVPLSYALAGFLWHTLPQKLQRMLSSQRIIFIVAVLPLSIIMAVGASPYIDQWLFGSSFKNWLRGTDYPGSGWFLLLLPFTVVLTVILMNNVVNPLFRQISRNISASRESYLNLVRFLLGLVFSLGLAWLLGHLLGMVIDPRSSIFGKYDQKNALVVGLMMGFAIIPIIYTLAEDALSSVPDHLRSASLGCGATTWQTASRIVLPTAMGGIFSAIMVGLGRAVGETMIVLMAAGNVPVLDMNLFNGFRTLSANIAVELPEAVQGSTHYRTLFLTALTLFLFTFILNTLAESLRQRFRKRAFEL